MPYKDKKKQRAAVRAALQKHRAKRKQQKRNFEMELRKIVPSQTLNRLKRDFPASFPKQPKKRKRRRGRC